MCTRIQRAHYRIATDRSFAHPSSRVSLHYITIDVTDMPNDDTIARTALSTCHLTRVLPTTTPPTRLKTTLQFLPQQFWTIASLVTSQAALRHHLPSTVSEQSAAFGTSRHTNTSFILIPQLHPVIAQSFDQSNQTIKGTNSKFCAKREQISQPK